jgi:uncharacterized alpha-E superfamily protein
MLSRVADSLYWMSRYIERAENVTRILAVNFNALLDAPMDDDASWRPLIATGGDDALFGDIHADYSTRNVIDFMLWHTANPNAVINCITRARENARGVREQISSEMWEHLNKLYLTLRETDRDAAGRSPAEFFIKVREGSHAFQGITHATLSHGEGYEFIQLGKYIERAGTTLRMLDAKYLSAQQAPEGSAESQLQLIAMLKSCSAFEAFRKGNPVNLQAWRVLDYLLLSETFPRAVRYCVRAASHALDAISVDPNRAGGATPQKLLGRIAADLDFVDLRDVLSANVHEYLNDLQGDLGGVAEAIARTCFSTQVMLAAPRSVRQAMAASQQQQQQQQQ